MNFEANPAWATRILETEYDTIARLIDRGMPAPVQQAPWDIAELGCGHYGCVYPTQDPAIVFKITTDEAEARLVHSLRQLSQPKGLVTYYAIAPFRGTHRRKRTFGLWRESAASTGLWTDPGPGHPYDRYPYGRMFDAVDLIYHFLFSADKIRSSKNWNPDRRAVAKIADKIRRDIADRTNEYRGPEGTPEYRAALCVATASSLDGPFQEIGRALLRFMSRGVLLADVHVANIGQIPLHHGFSPNAGTEERAGPEPRPDIADAFDRTRERTRERCVAIPRQMSPSEEERVDRYWARYWARRGRMELVHSYLTGQDPESRPGPAWNDPDYVWKITDPGHAVSIPPIGSDAFRAGSRINLALP